jgi:ABC-type polysaccharide/polyol phosphate transport system ATPase subunit
MKYVFSFKKRQKTIVVVIHDLETIKDHCDRAMFLNNGIIPEIGEPQKVIETYERCFSDEKVISS